MPSRRFLDRRRSFAHLVAALVAFIAVAAAASVSQAEFVYVVGKSTNTLSRFSTTGPFAVTPLLFPSNPLDLSTSPILAPSALTLGPDGALYIGEWGDGVTDPRVSRYDIMTGNVTTVVTLDPDDMVLPQTDPTAIAFHSNGDMLIGRLGIGPILRVTNWSGPTPSPVVSAYTATIDGGLGLAIDGSDQLYVSDSAYSGPTASGPIIRFDASGSNETTIANDGSGGLAGPTGLVLAGNSLFSASVMTGQIFETDLTNSDPSTNTSLFATAPAGMFGTAYTVGPLAMLLDGSLVSGDVTGAQPNVHLFSSTGTYVTTFSDLAFGQVGGLVVAPVPEPSGLLFLATGGVVFGWYRWKSRAGGR